MGTSSTHRLGEPQLLALIMQSDGSPHFLMMLRKTDVNQFDILAGRTSPSPCEEIIGRARDLPRLVTHKLHKIPWQIGKGETKRPLRGPVREEAGADPQKLHHARRVAAVDKTTCVPLRLRAARVVEIVAWAAIMGTAVENADYLTPHDG